jgi:hypothetical protein
MTDKPSRRKKKYFTVAEANAALPLIRAILRDIIELAGKLREHRERLVAMTSRSERTGAGGAYIEELEEDFRREGKRLEEFQKELQELGVELKDYFTGLVDFPSWMDGREVYLCWRLGEPEVAHWHELDAGFAGRKKLMIPAAR